MKRMIGWAAALALCLAASGGAAPACERWYNLDLEIGFDFEVDGVKLPAGHYVISNTDLPEEEVLRISKERTAEDKGRKTSTTFFVENVTAEALPTSTHLTFSQDGDKHVLHQIWMEDKMTGCQVKQAHKHQPHHKKKHVDATDNRDASQKAD